MEKTERSRQTRRLQWGLLILKKNRQITTRDAINLATIFTVMLANAQTYLTARDLATLTHLMMRTLDEGRCGSRQRFRWFLSVIERFLGAAARGQVDLILKRRRDANYALWRRDVAIGARAEHHGSVPKVRPKLQPVSWAWTYMNRNRMKLVRARSITKGTA